MEKINVLKLKEMLPVSFFSKREACPKFASFNRELSSLTYNILTKKEAENIMFDFLSKKNKNRYKKEINEGILYKYSERIIKNNFLITNISNNEKGVEKKEKDLIIEIFEKRINKIKSTWIAKKITSEKNTILKKVLLLKKRNKVLKTILNEFENFKNNEINDYIELTVKHLNNEKEITIPKNFDEILKNGIVLYSIVNNKVIKNNYLVSNIYMENNDDNLSITLIDNNKFSYDYYYNEVDKEYTLNPRLKNNFKTKREAVVFLKNKLEEEQLLINHKLIEVNKELNNE